MLFRSSLRRLLQVNNQKLTDALRELQREDRVESLGHMGGWRLRAVPEGHADVASAGG